MDARSSPWTFAACRALPRRTAPRHPPRACSRLAILPLPRAPSSRLRGRPSFFASCLSSLPWSCQRTSVLETRGFEPLTSGLQSRRSSQLSHAPEKSLSGKSGKKEGNGTLGRRLQPYTGCLPLSKKGGDPAAPSGTTTLLRLHPPHEASLRHGPPCGRARGFGRAPLGWCDGRCVQGPGTYSPRRADARLLAIPTSRSRVSDSDPD